MMSNPVHLVVMAAVMLALMAAAMMMFLVRPRSLAAIGYRGGEGGKSLQARRCLQYGLQQSAFAGAGNE
jgi:hypothetical protein